MSQTLKDAKVPIYQYDQDTFISPNMIGGSALKQVKEEARQ